MSIADKEGLAFLPDAWLKHDRHGFGFGILEIREALQDVIRVHPARSILAGKKIKVIPEGWTAAENRVEINKVLPASAVGNRNKLHQRNIPDISDGKETIGSGIEQETIRNAKKRHLDAVP